MSRHREHQCGHYPDMKYVDVRQTLPWFKCLMLAFFSSASVRLIDHVITIPNFSKSVICRRLGTAPSIRVSVHLCAARKNRDVRMTKEDDQRKGYAGDSVGMICAVQERGYILQVMTKQILCYEREWLGISEPPDDEEGIAYEA